MIKLSTKTRYGTRIMVELAKSFGEGNRSVSQLSEAQDLSPKYVEHIMSRLKTVGLVKVAHGRKGGYSLLESPAEINLNEITHALEDNFEVVYCLNGDNLCGKEDSCITRPVWMKLKNTIDDLLSSISLDDIACGRVTP